MLETGQVAALPEVIGHLNGEGPEVARGKRVGHVVDDVEHEVVREAERRHREDERLGDHHRDREQDPEAAASEDAFWAACA